MSANAFLLDVTRLVSRIGQGALTGIDRVELAYVRHLPKTGRPVYGVMRTPAGLVILRPEGLGHLSDMAQGGLMPQRRDLVARLSRRSNPMHGAVETAIRRFALARVPMTLARFALRRALPKGTVYLNVGHANLSVRMLSAVKSAGLRSAVLVHDTIPLDHPEFTRQGHTEIFARKLAAVSGLADVVIHSAHATRTLNDAQLARMGRVPPGIVAALGVDLVPPDASALPPGLDLTQPYFVCLGTIEPRKNHALLLDVWEAIAHRQSPQPTLFILGNRGWADPELFARLDRGVPGVRVLSGLSDSAVSALMANARAVLFPSHVEGYGLPAFEAAALGVPLISSGLSVIRETLSDYPVYLEPTDSYSWMETILSASEGTKIATDKKQKIDPPTWEDHIKTVLKEL